MYSIELYNGVLLHAAHPFEYYDDTVAGAHASAIADAAAGDVSIGDKLFDVVTYATFNKLIQLSPILLPVSGDNVINIFIDMFNIIKNTNFVDTHGNPLPPMNLNITNDARNNRCNFILDKFLVEPVIKDYFNSVFNTLITLFIQRQLKKMSHAMIGNTNVSIADFTNACLTKESATYIKAYKMLNKMKLFIQPNVTYGFNNFDIRAYTKYRMAHWGEGIEPSMFVVDQAVQSLTSIFNAPIIGNDKIAEISKILAGGGVDKPKITINGNNDTSINRDNFTRGFLLKCILNNDSNSMLECVKLFPQSLLKIDTLEKIRNLSLYELLVLLDKLGFKKVIKQINGESVETIESCKKWSKRMKSKYENVEASSLYTIDGEPYPLAGANLNDLQSAYRKKVAIQIIEFIACIARDRVESEYLEVNTLFKKGKKSESKKNPPYESSLKLKVYTEKPNKIKYKLSKIPGSIDSDDYMLLNPYYGSMYLTGGADGGGGNILSNSEFFEKIFKSAEEKLKNLNMELQTSEKNTILSTIEQIKISEKKLMELYKKLIKFIETSNTQTTLTKVGYTDITQKLLDDLSKEKEISQTLGDKAVKNLTNIINKYMQTITTNSPTIRKIKIYK